MTKIFATASILVLFNGLSALAADATPDAGGGAGTGAATSPAPARAGRLDVDKLKQKYWANGEGSELQVVQNRLYTKENKFEIGAFGGFLTTDPFLSVKTAGGSLGYHLSEYFSITAVGWKDFVSDSTASATLIQKTGSVAAVNRPKNFLGGELGVSALYGKLSVFGRAIVYYDIRLSLGGGITDSETGKLFTPYINIGQKFYLTQALSVGVDYRIMQFRERVNVFDTVAHIYALSDPRTTWSQNFTIGLSVLFGL